MNTVYIVIMHRWGDRECHSYFLTVKETPKEAFFEAAKEYSDRAGKYEPEIIEQSDLNKTTLVALRGEKGLYSLDEFLKKAEKELLA